MLLSSVQLDQLNKSKNVLVYFTGPLEFIPVSYAFVPIEHFDSLSVDFGGGTTGADIHQHFRSPVVRLVCRAILRGSSLGVLSDVGRIYVV